MARSKRVKRASAEDLYRTCKVTGTCPPDIVPKIEGDTWADRILKYGALGVFLGGLGIGTGQARGGVGTYRPLRPVETPFGSRPTGTTGARPSGLGRPFEAIPLDTIGAGSMGAGRSSIVPEAPSVITPDVVPSDPGVDALDIAVEAPSDPSLSFRTPSTTDDVAVLDVQPTEHDYNSHISSSTTHHNPSFRGVVQVANNIGEVSGSENIFLGGSNLGSSSHENIELDLFTEPRTSTPARQGRGRYRGRSNWFSRRYYTQVQVEDPQVFSNTFDNPAFQNDSFDMTVGDSEPLIPELRDVTHVSAAKLLRGPSGRLGVGRVGQARTIRTRSGVQIGGAFHFRHSYSTIEAADPDIELVTVPEVSDGALQNAHESTVIDGHEDYEEIDLDSLETPHSDAELLDTYSENVHGTLSFNSGSRSTVIPLEDVSLTFKPISNAPIDEWGITNTGSVDVTDNQDAVAPDIIIVEANVDGSYYLHTYLHPSLRRKKRRKRRYL